MAWKKGFKRNYKKGLFKKKSNWPAKPPYCIDGDGQAMHVSSIGEPVKDVHGVPQIHMLFNDPKGRPAWDMQPVSKANSAALRYAAKSKNFHKSTNERSGISSYTENKPVKK